MTFRRNLLLIVLAVSLAACATQAPVAPLSQAEQPLAPSLAATEMPLSTQAPVVETQPPATLQEPSASPEQTEPSPAQSSSAGMVYKIIPGESQLKYEVGEVFLNQNNAFNMAVGTTPQVSGEITIDVENPQNSVLGPISADISQFTSDSGRRDNAIRGRYLESSRYPTVTFVAAEVVGLPEAYQEGQELALTVRGDLTIRDVTRPAEFNVTVSLASGSLTGTATTTILMSDFGFGPIDIAGILKTEDEAKVTLDFVARP